MSMAPWIQSLTLIRDRSFGAQDDVQFYTWDVKLWKPEEGSTSPRTTAISKYFLDRNNAHGLFKLHSLTHFSPFRVEVHKGFAKYVGERLACPFLEIRIARELEEYEDPANPPNLIVLEKCLPLQAFEDKGNFGVSEESDHHFVKFPFQNNFHHESNFLYTIKLGWEEQARKIKMSAATLMEKLFEDESSKDLTILAGNGAEVKCHKVIFAGQTRAFSAMLSAKTGMKEAKSMRVGMSGNSEEGIRKLVQYLYGLELDISEMGSDVALQLFQTAHMYGLIELEVSILGVFLEQEDKWFTPDVVLEIYFYVRNLDAFEKLREHALFLMASMPTEELCSCEVFKKLDKAEALGVSMKLVDYLKKYDFHQLNQPPVEMRDEGSKRRKLSY